MKYICPICQDSGDISENDLEYPVTRTTCQSCDTILMVNPDTGKVDAHKTPLKDSPAIDTSGNRSADKSISVRAMRSKDKDTKDWTAVVVVMIILIVLISAGIYFALSLELI